MPRTALSPYREGVISRSVLVGFRRREPGAVRTMYQEYGGLVFVVAHRVLGRRDLAEEATQQTFVRAWQAAERLDVDRDPAAWLATIAKHVAIDLYRRESRHDAGALTDVSMNDPAVVSLPPELDTLDAVWHVRRAIDALPDDEAAIVRLQHLQGMTHREIASALDLAIGTVKSRSFRAHRKLASLLGHMRESVS